MDPKNLTVAAVSVIGVIQALGLLAKYRCRAVIGTGGYSAWPVCAAARLSGRPYFLLEQNAVPGVVTRLLARGSRRVYLGYEQAGRQLRVRADRLVFSGNPHQISDNRPDKAESRRRLGLEDGHLTLLVTGGSGGARSINCCIDQAKMELLNRGWNLIWQTGKQWDGSFEVAGEFRGRLLMERFLDRERMNEAYGAADAAVARCGAITLAELSAVGLPAILVPFPYAAEGHQEANARVVEKAGAAMVVLDRDFGPGLLIRAITELEDPRRREAMAVAAKRMAGPGAADAIAKDILNILNLQGAP
jgi:UDP-N-acetylglucosamine--N-acetylmuramyl-(pentapeptide) pyrophosphoryl-undecaprenol N-acetylglucosamine transferase